MTFDTCKLESTRNVCIIFFVKFQSYLEQETLETYPNKVGQEKYFLSEFFGNFWYLYTEFNPKIVIDRGNVTAGTVGTV